MLDSFSGALMHAAGGIALGALLPFAAVVGVGLIWIGLVRQRPTAVVYGVVLPVGVFILGTVVRGQGRQQLALLDLPASNADVEMLLPITGGLAVVAFLVGVLPLIIKAHRD